MQTEDWKSFLNKYTTPEQEKQHVYPPDTSILCDLSSYGLLQVSGADSQKLLQGQLTCDVSRISDTHSSMGAHCNAQGRIISLFYLFQFQGSYYLLLPRSMLDIALAALKKYAVFYKVTLVNASDNLIIIGHSGKDFSPDHYATAAIIHTGGGRRVIVAEPGVIKSVWDTLAQNATVASLHAWKHLNISDSIPTVYPETSEKFLPHELNLDKLNAISFDKGCYTGQEIIARMHYRGKLKNHMYLTKITSNTAPLPGDDISSLQGQDIRASGLVVDACVEDRRNYIALITTDESNVKNEHLFLDHDYKAFFTFLTN
jgi:folate-binding protein YgfZ